jgi:hypothetical protein
MATYYWVGGAGTWDDITTTNWAATSGGSGGAGVPTSADDVEFDGNSGAYGSVVTVANGAVAKEFQYSNKRVEFSGAGATLTLYGSIYVVVEPPSGIIDIDEIFMRVNTATGTSISSPAPFKNLSFRNTVSPTAKATVALNYTLSCKYFTSQDVSFTVLSPAFPINCTRFRLEDYGTGTGRTLGVYGSSFNINIAPEAAGTAFSCVWNDALAAFYGVTVTISDAVGNQSVSSSLQADYATSFTLVVDNSIISTAEVNGGLEDVTLSNAASFKVGSTSATTVFGSFDVNSGCTVDANSSSSYLSVVKRAATPAATRNIRNFTGGTWKNLGIRNTVAVGTDTIYISGNIGTSANLVGDFYTGAAAVNSGTMYANSVLVSNGTVFSDTVINAATSFTIAPGSSVSGSYTVNTEAASISTNGYAIPNLNIVGGGTAAQLVTSLATTNLSITTDLGGGGGGLLVRNGSTITVGGTLTLSGASASDIVDFRAYNLFGATPLPWYLVKTSGTVNATNTRIAYSNASGGARFQAFTVEGCINGGNNTGWVFSKSLGNFFAFL